MMSSAAAPHLHNPRPPWLLIIIAALLIVSSFAALSPAKAQSGSAWCSFLDFRNSDYSASYPDDFNTLPIGDHFFPGYGIGNYDPAQFATPPAGGEVYFSIDNTLTVAPTSVTLTFVAANPAHDNINITMHAGPFGITDPGILSDQVNRNLSLETGQQTVSVTVAPSSAGQSSKTFTVFFAADDLVYLQYAIVSGEGVDPFPSGSLHGESAVPCAYETATPTQTFTPSLTPSLTLTPSQTLTPTQTLTPSATPSPTATSEACTVDYDFAANSYSSLIAMTDATYVPGSGYQGDYIGATGANVGHQNYDPFGYFTLPDTVEFFSVDVYYYMHNQAGGNASTAINAYTDSAHTDVAFGGGNQWSGTYEGNPVVASIPTGTTSAPHHTPLSVVYVDLNEGLGDTAPILEKISISYLCSYNTATPTSSPTFTPSPSQTAVPSATVTLFPTNTLPAPTETPLVIHSPTPSLTPSITYTPPPLGTLPPPPPTRTLIPSATRVLTGTPDLTMTPTITPTFTVIVDPLGGGTVECEGPWFLGVHLCILQTIADFFNWLVNTLLGFFEWLLSLANWLISTVANLFSFLTNLLQALFSFLQFLLALLNLLLQIVGLLLQIIVRLIQLFLGWLFQWVSVLQGIILSWQTAAPVAIPGLPDCINAPFAPGLFSDVCATYYLVQYTILGGTLGQLMIAVLKIMVGINTLGYFIYTVNSIWDVLEDITHGT